MNAKYVTHIHFISLYLNRNFLEIPEVCFRTVHDFR
jgi:hypothetical protein